MVAATPPTVYETLTVDSGQALRFNPRLGGRRHFRPSGFLKTDSREMAGPFRTFPGNFENVSSEVRPGEAK